MLEMTRCHSYQMGSKMDFAILFTVSMKYHTYRTKVLVYHQGTSSIQLLDQMSFCYWTKRNGVTVRGHGQKDTIAIGFIHLLNVKHYAEHDISTSIVDAVHISTTSIMNTEYAHRTKLMFASTISSPITVKISSHQNVWNVKWNANDGCIIHTTHMDTGTQTMHWVGCAARILNGPRRMLGWILL